MAGFCAGIAARRNRHSFQYNRFADRHHNTDANRGQLPDWYIFSSLQNLWEPSEYTDRDIQRGASGDGITILTLIVGSYQTGIYSAAYRIYGSLLNIPIAIFSSVLPVMASQY